VPSDPREGDDHDANMETAAGDRKSVSIRDDGCGLYVHSGNGLPLWAMLAWQRQAVPSGRALDPADCRFYCGALLDAWWRRSYDLGDSALRHGRGPSISRRSGRGAAWLCDVHRLSGFYRHTRGYL
jgi:hypothetical protein